jgi:hypothetical protein
VGRRSAKRVHSDLALAGRQRRSLRRVYLVLEHVIVAPRRSDHKGVVSGI